MANKTKRVPWLGGYEVQASFDAEGKTLDYLVTHGARDIVCRVVVTDNKMSDPANAVRFAAQTARRIAVGLVLVSLEQVKIDQGHRRADSRLMKAFNRWSDEASNEHRRLGSYARFINTGVTP